MVTTAIVGHVLFCCRLSPASGDVGPWWLRDARPALKRDRVASGYDRQLGGLCRHAKSARWCELRLGVYTRTRVLFPRPEGRSGATRDMHSAAAIHSLA